MVGFIDKLILKKVNEFMEKYMKCESFQSKLIKGLYKIKNMNFGRRFINDFDLPFEIVYSHIDLVEVHLSLTKLRNHPVMVKIKNFHMVLRTKSLEQICTREDDKLGIFWIKKYWL